MNREFSLIIVSMLTSRRLMNCVAVHLAADYGPWSSFGECQCDLTKSRSRVCKSEQCDGVAFESQACACVPLDAAGMFL